MKTAVQPLEGVPWFDVDDPNSPGLDELAARFHLHELQIEDCRHGKQRAKSEEHPSYVFSVFKYMQPGKKFTFLDFDVFLGSDFVVTVHKGDCGAVEKVRKRAVEKGATRLDQLFYIMMDTIVDEYMLALDEVAESTAFIETQVLRRPEPPVLKRIIEQKRQLIEFRRVASGMREVANAIQRRVGGFVGDDLDPYFRDIYDHLVRCQDMVESYRDILTGTLDIYLSAVANRTNEVMKVLTFYGTIALPLLIVTGFFGMNLSLPWAESPHGVLYAVGLMMACSLAVVIYLRRKRWL